MVPNNKVPVIWVVLIIDDGLNSVSKILGTRYFIA